MRIKCNTSPSSLTVFNEKSLYGQIDFTNCPPNFNAPTYWASDNDKEKEEEAGGAGSGDGDGGGGDNGGEDDGVRGTGVGMMEMAEADKGMATGIIGPLVRKRRKVRKRRRRKNERKRRKKRQSVRRKRKKRWL